MIRGRLRSLVTGSRAIRHATFRTLGITAVMALLVLIPLGVRVAWEGNAELESAAAARARGDSDGEIEHLGRAARWRLPLAAHTESALERLREIGELEREKAASEGDVSHLSLAAYREIRRAILATRAWGIPYRERLDEANLAIAQMMAAQERAFGTDVVGRGDLEGGHLELLEQELAPGPLWARWAAVSFALWLLSTVMFFTRAIDPRGRLRPRPALIWGVLALIFLALWMGLVRSAG